jgi:hypothetical protein
MSTHNPRRIDRHTSEHLLGQASMGIRNAPMGIRDCHPPLAALLTAAAVPGRPDELAREQASVAAFRTAQLTPIPRPRRLSVVKTVVMKVLTVKAVAVLAATTAGGVALAASTGTLPNPLAQPARVTSSGLSAAPPTAEQSRGEQTRSEHPNSSKGPKTSKSPDASKAPSPSLVGLCQAYSTGNKAKHGKSLDNPAFTALLTSAGGKDKVDRFCQALLAAQTPANSDAQHGGRGGEDRHGGGRDGGRHDDNDHTDDPNQTSAQPSRTPER